jgi:hypothetical protein
MTDDERERAVDAAVACFERAHAHDLSASRDKMMLDEVQREHPRLRKWWTIDKETKHHGTRTVAHGVFVCRVCGRRLVLDDPAGYAARTGGILAFEHAWFHLREVLRRQLERGADETTGGTTR